MSTDGQTEPFGDLLRRQAATWGHAAEVHNTLARELREIIAEHRVPPPDLLELAALATTDAERAKLMQWLAAAQALAHDELLARGGADNAEAFADYRRTTRRNLALMPKEFGTASEDK